jgi:hypothetical protein
MNTYIVDSGSTTRKLKTLWVVDSGSVSRKVKKLWVIDSGSVARLVYTANIFTLTSGSAGGSSGYASGGFGSIAPSNTLADDNLISQISSSNTAPHPLIVTLTQAGGGPSISSGYLVNISIAGTILLGSAATFAGGGSVGSWTWSTGLSLAAGPYAVILDVT